MNEMACTNCEKNVETERVAYRKAPDTYWDRCLECGEPVSAKDGMIKRLMLDVKNTEQRTNLVIGAGITVFLVISLIREFF